MSRTELKSAAEKCGVAPHEIQWMFAKRRYLLRIISQLTHPFQNFIASLLSKGLRQRGTPLWNDVVLDIQRPQYENILRESLLLIEKHCPIGKMKMKDHVAIIGIGDDFTYRGENYARMINISHERLPPDAPLIAGIILRRYATRRILNGRIPFSLYEEVKARCGGYRYERRIMNRLKTDAVTSRCS